MCLCEFVFVTAEEVSMLRCLFIALVLMSSEIICYQYIYSAQHI